MMTDQSLQCRNESDEFIDQLLEDLEQLDQFDDSDLFATGPETTSLSENNDHTDYEDSEYRIVYVKKRKYERKQKIQKNPKIPPITFPRILKSDIRRKYMFMYENVMNSFDYQLIYSFFHQFTKEDIPLERKRKTDSGEFAYSLITAGATHVTEFFLLMLQITPDKVTRLSDIQIKQSSADRDRTEISCTFTSHNTPCYAIQMLPEMFPQMIQDVSSTELCQTEDGKLEACETVIQKKRKSVTGLIEYPSFHRRLFDPIDGTFIKSRFSRNQSSCSYVGTGTFSLIVNKEKLIERLVIFSEY